VLDEKKDSGLMKKALIVGIMCKDGYFLTEQGDEAHGIV